MSTGSDRSRWLARALVLAAVSLAAHAQQTNKVADFLRSSLALRSKQIIAAATEMPADRFGFKPSPQDMSFAQLILHVAVTNYQYCSKIGSVDPPALPVPPENESKDKLIARMKESFDFCTSALAKLDDSKKSELVVVEGSTKTSRAMAILTLTGAWNDHYALFTSYLQANGHAVAAGGPGRP